VRYTTSDPRVVGFADSVGAVMGYVNSGTIYTLVKVGSGSTDWTSVPALLPATPMDFTKLHRVTSDPSSAGLAAQLNEIALYYTGGVGQYLIKHGTGDTDWVQLPDTTGPGGGGLVADGDKGDITVTGSGVTWTIDNNVVSNAKLRDSGACSVIGRAANSSGDPADISASTNGHIMGRASDVVGFAAPSTFSIPTGSGTLNTIPKWTPSGTVLGDSAVSDDGTTVVFANRQFSDTYTGSGTLASWGMTGTGLTVNGVIADYSSSATYDTTASALSATGASYIMQGSRAAGANSLTQTAGLFSATGAQINIAVRTNSGQNWLNVTDSTTAIGYAAGSAPSSHKLGVKGDATATAIGAVNTSTSQGSHTGISSALSGTVAAGADRTATGVSSSVTVTRASGAANAINKAYLATASGGQINIAYESTVGDCYFATSSGSVGIGLASGAAFGSGSRLQVAGLANSHTARFTNSTTGQTTTGLALLSLANTGATYDTTAGAIVANGINILLDATESAGANVFQNRGIVVDVTGSDANTAIQTVRGDNSFNSTSGSSRFFGAVTIDGNTTIGNAAGDAHVVNGTLDCNQAVNIDGALVCTSTLSVEGNTTIGNAAGDAHVVNGTLDCNQAVNIDGALTATSTAQVTGKLTALAEVEIDGAINHDGTTIGVFGTAPTTKQTVTGSRTDGTALASLLTALAAYGLITDSSTA